MPTRFHAGRVHFGHQPAEDTDDNGEGLPKPLTVKAQARRLAGIREAKAVLDCLPSPGESLHAIVTARMDLTDVVNALIDRVGPCERMTVATLGYNAKNLKQMLDWIDTGKVKSLTLLASIFFRSHKGALWTETLSEFRDRGQRTATCHSHCKVIAMQFSDGRAFSIEGSANLCGNGSGREQFALFNSTELADWHARWIEELVAKHEGQNESE